MSELWKALVARMAYWLTPKPHLSLVAQPEEPELRPGTCECTHERCAHVGGKGRCAAAFPADAEWPKGAVCACQMFIRDDDNNGENDPETPSPKELERLYLK